MRTVPRSFYLTTMKWKVTCQPIPANWYCCTSKTTEDIIIKTKPRWHLPSRWMELEQWTVGSYFFTVQKIDRGEDLIKRTLGKWEAHLTAAGAGLPWGAQSTCWGAIHWGCRAALGQLQPCRGFVPYYILVPKMEARVGVGTQVPQMAGSCPRCGLWCRHPAYTSMGRAKHLRVRSSQHPDQVNKYLLRVTGSVRISQPCLTWTEAPPSEEMAGINGEYHPQAPQPAGQDPVSHSLGPQHTH